jgi:hypothetical protein
VPGEIATYLLGAQGGIEDDFARLYAATNPVVLRYLRVTTDADADPADLALGAWSTALHQLKVCPADDDAWLEVVVGAAREAAAGSLRLDGGTPSTGTGATDPDDVDRAIESLRTLPADQADVLAMGVIANLGREATSRLTGHEPGAVLALVQDGQEQLETSTEDLIAALRAPARPDEVADLVLVTPLMTAALIGPAPTAAPKAAPMGKGAAWAEAFEASLAQPSVVEPLGLASVAQAPSSAFHLTAVGSPTGAPSRSARAGVAATVWVVALGGVGTAAAMSGLLTAAIDGILGDHGRPTVITAQGPVTPGTPSTGDGTTAGEPQPEPSTGGGTASRDPGTSQPVGSRGTGSVTQAVSLPGDSTGAQIVLASYVPPDRSTPSTPAGTPATPPATPPSTPPTTPPTTPPPPQTVAPQPGKGAGPVKAGSGSAHGPAKAAAKAARAAAKAAKAQARADAKAAKKAKAAKAAKDKAAKAKAAKAAKGKDHHQGKSKGKSKGTAKA